MADSYGPVVGGKARIWCSYFTSPGNTFMRVSIKFSLEMVNSGTSSGTWPASWSGYWGSNGNNIYRNLPPTSKIVEGVYDIPRLSYDRNVTFQAQAGSYHGTASHSQTIHIPKAWTVPPAPKPVSLSNITSTSMMYQFQSTGDGGRPISKWEFQYSVNSNFSGASAGTSSGTSTINGLANRTRYYFRARGVNSVGTGPWSSVISAETLGLPDEPSLSPNGVTATTAAFRLADGAYTGGGITGRESQLSRNEEFTSLVGTNTTATPSWSSLTRATPYYARGRVRNSTGWSPWSDTVAILTNVELPSAPSGYTVTDIASTTAYTSSPAVLDNGGGVLTNVRAQLNTSKSETGATIVTEGGYRPVFLQNLTPGRQYWLRLAVYNTGTGGGWSPYGDWISFTARNDVPTPPLNLAAQVLGDTRAKLTWAVPANLQGSELLGYTIRVATDPAFATDLQFLNAPANATTFTLDGLLKGTRYYVQVSALSSGGPGSASNVVNFLTTGTAPVPQPVWLRVSGAWRPGKFWLRVGGVWREVRLWTRTGGVWREG